MLTRHLDVISLRRALFDPGLQGLVQDGSCGQLRWQHVWQRHGQTWVPNMTRLRGQASIWRKTCDAKESQV